MTALLEEYSSSSLDKIKLSYLNILRSTSTSISCNEIFCNFTESRICSAVFYNCHICACVYVQFLSTPELNPCLIMFVIIMIIIVGSFHSIENKDGLLLSVDSGRECAWVTVCKLLRLKASAQTALTAF